MIAEMIGQVLGKLPFYISLPLAAVVVMTGWVLWEMFIDPFGIPQYDRWRKRRQQEKVDEKRRKRGVKNG